MAHWYYERDNVPHGPVDEAALSKLYERGALNDHTPVWTVDAPDRRTVLGATGIDLPPPPASAISPPSSSTVVQPLATSASEAPGGTAADDDFFTSPVVRAYVGKNVDTYLAKWKAMHEKANGDWNKTISRPSWNWPAFLMCYAWPFYRKMWLLGGVVLAVLVVANFATDKSARLVGIGVSVALAIMANALYLRQVRTYWAAHRNTLQPAGKTPAMSAGGTNLWAGVGGIVSLSALAALAGIQTGELDGLFGSGAGCSSKAAIDTVAKLARQNMGKQGMDYLGVDIEGTRVYLEAVRTQSTSRKTECAATIKYGVKLGPGAKPEAKANIEGINTLLQSDITYTVETTDDGKNIYVTVRGLTQ